MTVEDGRLVYGFKEGFNTVGVVNILSKYMLCIMCFMSSLGFSDWGLGIMGLDVDNFQVIMLPVSLMSLTFVALSLKTRNVTIGVVLLMFSIYQTVDTVAQLSFDTGTLSGLQLYFVIGFATASYIYKVRGQFDYIPTALLSLMVVISALPDQYNRDTMAIGYWIVGALYFLSASLNMYRYSILRESGRTLVMHETESAHEYSHTLVETVGVLTFSILSMVMCYYVLDGSHATNLYILKMFLSLLVLMFGLYAINNGAYGEGVLMFGISIYTLLTAFMHLLHIHVPEMLCMLMSLVYVPLTYLFLKERNWLLMITSALLFLILALEGVVHYAQYMEVIVTALKVVSCLMAITAWIRYETGTVLFRAFLPKEHAHHGKEEDAVVDHTYNAYMIVGLMMLWLGINNIAYSIWGVDLGVFHIVCVFLSIPAVIHSRNLLVEGMTSEGTLMMISCLSVLSVSLADLFLHAFVPDTAHIMFAIVGLVSLVTFIHRRDLLMSVTSLALMASFTSHVLMHFPLSIWCGIPYIIAGVMMTLMCMQKMFPGLRYLPEPVPSGGSNSFIPFNLFLLSILCFMMFHDDVTKGLCSVGIVVSVTALITGIHNMLKGESLLFPLVMMVSVTMIADSIAYLLGAELPYFLYIPITMVALLMSVGLISAGRRVLGYACLVFGAMSGMGFILDDWSVIWYSYLVLALVTLAYAVNIWVMEGLGRRPLRMLDYPS